MTQAAALELRHVRLAEQVTLVPAPLGPTPNGGQEEGVFVALDDSPPVRTVLAVVEGDRRRALEVAWVVEVPGDDPGGPTTRGFYGRWVADEALERAARVGTEHLEDGTPVVQPVVYDNSAVLDMSDTGMAMPAPVIVHDDDTGVVDTRDDGDGDGDGDGREEASAGGGQGDDAPTVTLTVDERAADHGAARADGASEQTHETVSYPEHPYVAETVVYPEYPPAEEATGAPEQAQAAEAGDSTEAGESTEAGDVAEAAEAAESSTDAGEAPTEAGDGDAGSSSTKGRKKRGRRKR